MSRFAVWAPNADAVSLCTFAADAGDEAAPSACVELFRDADGTWSVDHQADSGTQYMFTIRRDGDEFVRMDPAAREVTSSVGRCVVAAPFDEWTDSGFVPRPLNEWVIYELHAGTFAGDLDTARERLELVADLGVTTIELMPVAEFAGDLSWGYNTALPFAVESSYGGPAALCRFVDAAHSRGIAVILDVVYNHLGPSDLDLWRFDGWYEGDGGGIWFYNDWRAQTPWGATRPDFGRPEVRGFLIDNARMWLSEYHLDGLRLDSTVNIRNAHGTGGSDGALPEASDFLRELTTVVRNEFPRAVLIAEDLQSDPFVTTPVDDGGLGFHLQWSAGFVHPVRGALEVLDDQHRDLDALVVAVHGGVEGDRRVVYTESHDEVANGRTRVPAEIDAELPGSVHAFRRSVVGAALVMAAAGVPMLFQGQEWADEDWFDDSQPLAWHRREQREGVVALWRDLIRLRTGVDSRALGLRGDRIDVWRGGDGGVIVVRRWGVGGETAAAIVAVNLTNEHQRVEVATDGMHCVFASDWSGYDRTGTDETTIGDGALELAPYGAAILAPARDEDM